MTAHPDTQYFARKAREANLRATLMVGLDHSRQLEKMQPADEGRDYHLRALEQARSTLDAALQPPSVKVL